MERFTYEVRTVAFFESLKNQSEETYIAEIGDEAVGIFTIGKNLDDDLDKAIIGEIWGIYLDPSLWRKGVATRLVQ